MRTVLIDRMRKNYKLPSSLHINTTPFPNTKGQKGCKVPGSNKYRKSSLFGTITDVPKRDKQILSLPDSLVEPKIIKNYEQINKKSHLDGDVKLNEDVIFESFKKLQHKKKAKSKRTNKKDKKVTKNKSKKGGKTKKSNIMMASKHFDVIQ